MQFSLPLRDPEHSNNPILGVSTLEFSLLSSGSRANCIYVASATTAILIDCGLSARETAKRLSSVGRSMEDIDAILVTHEHSDHIRGLSGFLSRRNIPVWMNRGTNEGASATFESLENPVRNTFCSDSSFQLGDLSITPFRVSHDANDPVMFRISSGGCAIAVATDLGHVTSSVESKLFDIDALIIETNHDKERLLGGPYPWHLKRRILGDRGHLSNEDAGKFLAALACRQQALPGSRRLQIVVGAHVSEQNNTPELAFNALCSAWTEAVQDFAALDYTPQYLLADAFRATPLVAFMSHGTAPAELATAWQPEEPLRRTAAK